MLQLFFVDRNSNQSHGNITSTIFCTISIFRSSFAGGSHGGGEIFSSFLDRGDGSSSSSLISI